MKKRNKYLRKIVSLVLCFTVGFTMISSAGFAQSETKDNTVDNKTVINKEENVIAETNDRDMPLDKAKYGINMKDIKCVVKGTTTANLYVRKQPLNASSKMGLVYKGTSVSIYGFCKEGNILWYEISYKGKRGYISAKYVSVYATTYKNRVGVTTGSVKAYIADDKNIVVESFYMPKGSNFEIVNRISTNDKSVYRIKYLKKYGFIETKNVNLNPILNKIDYPKASVATLNKTIKLYKGTTIHNTVVGTSSKGTKIFIYGKIIRSAEEWYKTSYKGKTVYCKAVGINLNPILETRTFDKKIYVELDRNLYMYKGTTIHNKVLATAPKGTKLVLSEKIKRQADTWYKTTYKGKTVYCKSKYVNLYAAKYSGKSGKTLDKVQVYKVTNDKLVKYFVIEKEKYFELLGRVSLENGNIYEIKYGTKKGLITSKNVNLNPILRQFKYSKGVHVKLDRDLYMYRGTTIHNKVLAKAPKETKLVLTEKIYRSSEAWYRTKYKGENVFCKSKYVKLSSERYSANSVRNTRGTFYLYEEPAANAETIVKVPVKTSVRLLGKVFTDNETYLEIEYNNTIGYADEKEIEEYIAEDYIINKYSYTMNVYAKAAKDLILYKEPDQYSKEMYSVNMGNKITAVGRVNKRFGSWYEVAYNGKTVYAKSTDVKLSEVIYKSIVGAYSKAPVYLRTSIGKEVSVKCTIPEKGVLEVLSKFDTSEGKWYKVKYAGTAGYVKGSYIKISQMGIDVSTFNTSIDWKKVKASGIDFVFIRAGYTGYGNGQCQTDVRFKRHMEGAISAGLDIGVYYFTQAIDEKEAEKEAKYTMSLIKPYKKYVNLPIVVDSEYINSSRPGRADHLSKTQRTKVLKAFCQEIEKQNRTPMIYMSKSWIKNQLNYECLDHFKLWVAQYNAYNTTPETYQYWQYTSGGIVPGIKGRVDMNIKIE